MSLYYLKSQKKINIKNLIYLPITIFSAILYNAPCFAQTPITSNQPQQQFSTQPNSVVAPAPQSDVDLQTKIKRLQEILSKAQQRPGSSSQNTSTASTQTTQTPSALVQATPGNMPTTPTSTIQPGQTNAQEANQAAVQPIQQNTNQATIPPAGTKDDQTDLYEQAFSGVVNQILPMSPEQITNLKTTFNEAQRAATAPVGIPPKPTSSSIIVNLAPHATPPVIRLQAGFITSLVFVDSTGQPWPIAAYSLGDPTAFNIQWDRKGNTLLVQSLAFYKRSNIAVLLKDLNTPVMLFLMPGQEAVDFRVDLRVPGLGPNAVVIGNGLPESTNPILVDVLNGVPPPNSLSLNVAGGDCQAWLSGNKLYLRTNLDVISPAYKQRITSIDGMHAYEIQKTPRILVLSRGKIKTLRIL